MPEEGNVDTSRATVKTFVPAYQKAEWKRHADELNMSQSEFVRTMVQAGRRDFDVGTAENARSETEGEQLQEHVLSILSVSEHLSWDELVERLTDDIEDRLDETLQRLQTENRVQYSGRHGGYALLPENDGK